jgi:hypothetical protein
MKYEAFKNKTTYKKIPPGKIIAWIEKNFTYKTRNNGLEYQICDPFDADTKFRFGINPENGICHSWHGDEWAGPINPKTGKRNCSVVKFVKAYRKCSYREALEELLGTTEGLSSYLYTSRIPEDTPKEIAVSLPDGVEPLSTSDGTQPSSLKKWLKSRGYTDERIEKSELAYLGMSVYWPYFEFDTLVYWQSRSRLNKRFEFPAKEIYDKQGQVIGKTNGSKGDFFYGFDCVEPASYLIITEAIFDQNTLYEQCLASGGADLTHNQIKKLKLLGPKKGIILSPDNDKAGVISIINNRQALQQLNCPLYYSMPPKLEYKEGGEIKYTKDWNEIGQKVSGFDKVREIHDSNIKKITPQEVIRLKSFLNSNLK